VGNKFRVNFPYTPVMSASRYEFDSTVRGFHEYESIWAPVVGKELPCKREVHNPHDTFAVSVTKDHVVVGHLSRKFSVIFWSFLRSSSITCKILSATRRYSRDLVLPSTKVLVECVLNFVDHRILNEKNSWILVIRENHEIKSTTEFLRIR